MKFPKKNAHHKGHIFWRPSRVPSLGGARYFVSIIDYYSRMTWVFMMKQKSKSFKFFKNWNILHGESN